MKKAERTWWGCHAWSFKWPCGVLVGTRPDHESGRRCAGISFLDRTLEMQWGGYHHHQSRRHLCLHSKEKQGFPGGPVVKNPPCKARGHRFDPCSGKIPHAMEQLSPWAPTAESALQSPRATSPEPCTPWSLCSATREATAMRRPSTATQEEPSLAETRAKPMCSSEDPAQPKTNLKKGKANQ